MKAELRKSLIKKRMAQSESEIIEKSKSITKRIISSGILDKPSRVLLYKDFKKEVITKDLITYLLEKGIEVALPRVSEDFKKMNLYLIIGDEDLELSSYGILEPIPSADREIQATTLDLVLAPGVGFTPDCYRIGYGGGFYDKMLSDITDVIVCALAFDCQIVDTLPLEAHDQQLDMIMTESITYKK